MAEESGTSRRIVIGGISTALAGGVARGSHAQQVATAPATPAPTDPLVRYPRPPFPKQEQPSPGLASKMNPRPDHGEHRLRPPCRSQCVDHRRRLRYRACGRAGP
jgi:hypothetical protein